MFLAQRCILLMDLLCHSRSWLFHSTVEFGEQDLRARDDVASEEVRGIHSWRCFPSFETIHCFCRSRCSCKSFRVMATDPPLHVVVGVKHFCSSARSRSSSYGRAIVRSKCSWSLARDRSSYVELAGISRRGRFETADRHATFCNYIFRYRY